MGHLGVEKAYRIGSILAGIHAILNAQSQYEFSFILVRYEIIVSRPAQNASDGSVAQTTLASYLTSHFPKDLLHTPY